nr:unnamed protein product [Callosobruchus chinensis]
MNGGVFCLLKTQKRFAECTFSLRVGYQGGSLVVWAGISLEARTELYIVPRGFLTAVRYIVEILQDIVCPYVDFIANNFILVHDNARPHTAIITQQYLNEVDIGRSIRSRVPIPLTLNELQHALLEEWDLIPQKTFII